MQIFTLRRSADLLPAERYPHQFAGRCETPQSRPRTAMQARVRAPEAAGAAPTPAAIEVLLPAGPLGKIHSASDIHAWRRWLPCPTCRWAHHDRPRPSPKPPEFREPCQAQCGPACTGGLPWGGAFDDGQNEYSSSVLQPAAHQQQEIPPPRRRAPIGAGDAVWREIRSFQSMQSISQEHRCKGTPPMPRNEQQHILPRPQSALEAHKIIHRGDRLMIDAENDVPGLHVEFSGKALGNNPGNYHALRLHEVERSSELGRLVRRKAPDARTQNTSGLFRGAPGVVRRRTCLLLCEDPVTVRDFNGSRPLLPFAQ